MVSRQGTLRDIIPVANMPLKSIARWRVTGQHTCNLGIDLIALLVQVAGANPGPIHLGLGV